MVDDTYIPFEFSDSYLERLHEASVSSENYSLEEIADMIGISIDELTKQAKDYYEDYYEDEDIDDSDIRVFASRQYLDEIRKYELEME